MATAGARRMSKVRLRAPARRHDRRGSRPGGGAPGRACQGSDVFMFVLSFVTAIGVVVVDHSPCLQAGDSWAEHGEPDRGTLP